MYDPTMGRFLQEDPTGLSGGDDNFYRYCGNDPLSATDPTGLAAVEKPASDASERAKELERILVYKLDALKQIAKDTKDVERFGVILKANDPNAEKQYLFREMISNKSGEKITNEFGQEELFGATNSPFQWYGSQKMHGGVVQRSGPGGIIDLNGGGPLLQGFSIEFDWHTHPLDGDPWPSTTDGTFSEKNDMVGVMIRYIGENNWAIWIIDNDGRTYEYKPPATPGK